MWKRALLPLFLASFSSGLVVDSITHLEKNVKERALEKLQEVFGLGTGERRTKHQVPPQFMTELYNNIADANGVTRKNSPFNARIVRSFIERDNKDPQYFFFNISGLTAKESVLEAQLHLYRMKTSPLVTSPTYIIRVYQIMEGEPLSSPDSHRLLSAHDVSAHTWGWEVFNVKEAVLDWVSGRRSNRGLLVTVSTLFEEPVQLHFARRNEHHNSKQPILVLFNTDRGHLPSTASTLHGGSSYYNYNDPGKEFSRRRRSLISRDIINTTISAGNTTGDECSRHQLYVDFQQIGWSSWIISPKGYSAFYCKGRCDFPLGQNLRPSNHATVQSIVHELRLSQNVDKPCCVPDNLLSLAILYYDENENVMLGTYEDMVAESCGCH